jgi:DNA (cytosine-5)-methyltransferase 1
MALNDLKFIDLFAGAGGLSQGLSEAGFDCLYANEIEPEFAQTYQRNHPETMVEANDIRLLDPLQIREALDIGREELDLIAGGPPCQGFSINAPIRSAADERNHLFREYLRFVSVFAPKAILIENVPGLVSFENGATLHAILESITDLGYGADVQILGTAYYGVPQMRWRTFIVGLRGMDVPSSIFPEPMYHAPIRPNFTTTFKGLSLVKVPTGQSSLKFTTVREAIGDLPPLINGERGEKVKQYHNKPSCDFQKHVRVNSNGVVNHEAPQLSEINLKRLK